MTRSFASLEVVYERLAVAIDQAGPEASEVFLAKLVLLLAEKLERPEDVVGLIEVCLKDVQQA
jgi:hypothetical protein